MARYVLGCDIGGTFTDIVLRGEGAVRTLKVSSTPDDYSRAILGAVREIREAFGIPAGEIDAVVHATTVATNTILEHKGAKTALLTTEGFRDVLEMRRLRIPVMYDLQYDKPAPLVPRRLRYELSERLGPRGDVKKPLDEKQARAVAGRLLEEGVESVAICLLHSYANPAHERRAAELVREQLNGKAYVSLSSDILPEIREYERTSTAVVNAYIGPIVRHYVSSLSRQLKSAGIAGPLHIMQSNGGTMSAAAAAEKPAFLVESGPAAGVIACADIARSAGLGNVISFDMGGTTAKAAIVEDGEPARTTEYEVGAGINVSSKLVKGGGYAIKLPFIDVSEIGAGGGSIVSLDAAGAIKVGPRSAGADPGPACYGLGGVEPTVTDANVVLGFIPVGEVADGEITIRRELAEAAVERVAAPLGLTVLEAADGIHRIANARMTRALRSVSSEKGRDPRDFAIIAYGGSGPVHAAGLAAELGATTICVPAVAGLFSAVGLLFARPEFHEVRSCQLDVDSVAPETIAALLDELQAVLTRSFAGRGEPEWVRTADLRYGGQSWEIEVPLPDGAVDRSLLAELRARFEDEHELLYGVRGRPGSPVEVRAVRLAALGRSEAPPSFDVADPLARERGRTRGMWLEGVVEQVHVRSRASFGAEPEPGPFLVDEYDTTVVVPRGWAVRRQPATGTLVLEQEAARA